MKTETRKHGKSISYSHQTLANIEHSSRWSGTPNNPTHTAVHGRALHPFTFYLSRFIVSSFLLPTSFFSGPRGDFVTAAKCDVSRALQCRFRAPSPLPCSLLLRLYASSLVPVPMCLPPDTAPAVSDGFHTARARVCPRRRSQTAWIWMRGGACGGSTRLRSVRPTLNRKANVCVCVWKGKHWFSRFSSLAFWWLLLLPFADFFVGPTNLSHGWRPGLRRGEAFRCDRRKRALLPHLRAVLVGTDGLLVNVDR